MEPHMFLQPRQMSDIDTLQAPTLNVSLGTTSWLVIVSNFTVSKPVALCIYAVADVWSVQRPFPKDLLAVQTAVGTIAMVAVAIFRAWGSILKIKIWGTPRFVPLAVLRKVTDVLDCSAERPRGRVGALFTAGFPVTKAPRRKAAVSLTAWVDVTLLECPTVTMLLVFHHRVSTLKGCQATV